MRAHLWKVALVLASAGIAMQVWADGPTRPNPICRRSFAPYAAMLVRLSNHRQ